MTEEPKPFLCRLRLHKWYVDAAMFSSADRCARCDEFRDERSGKRLNRERELWEAAPSDLPGMMDAAGWVLMRLNGGDRA